MLISQSTFHLNLIDSSLQHKTFYWDFQKALVLVVDKFIIVFIPRKAPKRWTFCSKKIFYFLKYGGKYRPFFVLQYF